MKLEQPQETGDCAICHQQYTWFGNSPEPLLSHEQRVCNRCNFLFVIPARLGLTRTEEEK